MAGTWRIRILLTLTFAALVAVSVSSQSGSVVIRAKTIYTITHGIIQNGEILVQDGKIKEVGQKVNAPAGAQEHRAEVVVPGFVDAHTHLALDRIGNGGRGMGPITSEWKAVDHFKPEDPMLPIALSGGVTTIMTGSGSAIIASGQSAAIKLHALSGPSKVYKPYVALKMAIRSLINIRPGEPPATIMGWYAVASEQFRKARLYQQAHDDFKAGKTTAAPARDERMEAWAAALRGDVMVHVHAFYPSEIQMVMKLAREYGFIDRLSFAHVTEAFPIASVMAKYHVYPVVGYPNVARYWGDSVSHNVVKELMDAGVAASFETDMSGEQDKVFREYAAGLVRHGLREDQALEAMTLNGAKALMLSDRIGSIDVGKDADLVLMDGPPLDMHAERVEKVFVEGVLEYSRTQPRQTAPLTAVGPFTPVKGALAPGTKSYALTNARIFTVTHGVVPNGTVVVKDGRIAEVKAGAAAGFPKDFPVVDLGGRVVLPGYVDARAFPNDWTGDLKFQVQNNENLEPIMPEMNARHGIDVWFPSFADLRELGVVSQNITPGLLNMIGGSGLVMKTPGMDLDEKVRMEPSSMVVTITPRELRTWTKDSQVPLTLDATVAMIRDAFTMAKEYAARGQGRSYNQRLEAMLPAIQGKVPVIIHANDQAEIEAALKLASDFGLRPIISGGVEAYKVADQLVRAKAGVILGNSATAMEAVRGGGRGYTDQAPLYLSRAGVKVSFFGFSGARRGSPKGRLGADPALNAAWAFRNGVPEEEALRMVTIYPAEMCGMGDRIGSLDVGKDADLLVMAGHPFDYHVLPELVIADGQVVVTKLPGWGSVIH